MHLSYVDLHAPLRGQDLGANRTYKLLEIDIIVYPLREIHASIWIIVSSIETCHNHLAGQAGTAQ